MTEIFEPVDAWDARLVLTAGGALAELNRAGVLGPAAVHAATRVGALGGEPDERVLLAAALAVRAVTHGSVGVDLRTVSDLAPHLPWPDPRAWTDAVLASPLVDQGLLRVEHGLVYLDRFHRLAVQVCDDLVARAERPPPEVDRARLDQALDRIFPADRFPEQRAAAHRAATAWTTVVTGGPGTGKTTTVAGLIAVLHDQAVARGERFSVAMTAPTGKAAARLQESVREELGRFPERDRGFLVGLQPMTLHRLLGWLPGNSTRFRHHRGNRLGHDLVVVDESSMVDLLLMGRLLEAVRPDARLVLVGDPDQLTSVGAGAVLRDLVRGYQGRADSPVVSLATAHRYGARIAALAAALRDGDQDAVVAILREDAAPDASAPSDAEGTVDYVDTARAEVDAATVLRPTLLGSAERLRTAGAAGDVPGVLTALDEHRLICAHRDGPFGVAHWNRQVERWLAQAAGVDYWPVWYAGRPLLVTANDYGLGIYNGETGAVVSRADGGLRAVISGSAGPLDLATTRVADVDTMHALTVHKSQGSQADSVTVLLPPEDSRLLTRELFYTAVTRARRRVRIVGSEGEVRAAVARTTARATGLRERLVAAPGRG